MMQMDRDMRGGGVGNVIYAHYHHNQHLVDLSHFYDDYDDDDSSSSLSKMVPTSSSSSPVIGVANGAGYIEHHVSKMDTLAGVAIKYGVEVADIKKMNSLVTDLQMFALKTLHIPLPGRHHPSPCLSNSSDSPCRQSGYDRTPQSRAFPDLLDSFQSLKVNSSPQRKASPAMSTLQGFYGLNSSGLKRNQSEGFEMAVLGKEDGPFPKQLLHTNPPLSRHRKSKSVANGFFSENGDLADGFDSVNDDSDKWIDNLLRRGQRPDPFASKAPEIMLKEDPSSSSGGFSALKGKGLALRSNATSRTCLVAEDEVSGINCSSTGSSGICTVTDHHSGVRKSSSTSSLQDQESCSSSMWLTCKWNLKTDLQALSAAAISRPIFDGLPKPVTGRKNKAALD